MTEAADRVDFSHIRYAQCWEDADILLEALDIQEGDHCLAIASAGDNALAMLICNPEKVYALDLSPAQLACLELRVAAYRRLNHGELLALIGTRLSHDRLKLYQTCRSALSSDVQEFWDKCPQLIQAGIGSVGKFERYLALFRTWVLPLIHSHDVVKQLLQPKDKIQREQFYQTIWDTWQWRGLFQVFFSRAVMGRLGRDPAFFRYVEGNVAERIMKRARFALTNLNPAENPYLQWILTGKFGTALPLSLRPEHFETIKNNLDRLEWQQYSLESFLQNGERLKIHRFNLSDIFEYMSESNYTQLLNQIVERAYSGGRLVYWNMLVPRSRPLELAQKLIPLESLAQTLYLKDKAFFYSRLVIEEVAK